MCRKEYWMLHGALQAAVPPGVATSVPSTPVASAPVPAPVNAAALPVSPRAAACITQGLKIKGEIFGKEALFIDGPI